MPGEKLDCLSLTMVSKTRRTEESSAAAPLRWSVERRLAFVEERLFWLGEVNRTDLVRRFGVSMSQASGDIGRYLALMPKGVAYDKSAKRYVADESFRPVIAPADARRFLGELRLADLGVLAAEDTLTRRAAAVRGDAGAGARDRSVVLRALLRAIRERARSTALYQSMSRPTRCAGRSSRMRSPTTASAGTRARSTARAASSAISCSGGCRSRRLPAPAGARPRRTTPPGTASSRS